MNVLKGGFYVVLKGSGLFGGDGGVGGEGYDVGLDCEEM